MCTRMFILVVGVGDVNGSLLRNSFATCRLSMTTTISVSASGGGDRIGTCLGTVSEHLHGSSGEDGGEW